MSFRSKKYFKQVSPGVNIFTFTIKNQIILSMKVYRIGSRKFHSS